ncbi:MAG: hypothetical protein ACXAC8_17640 [Candidatus Hodarchaeales archaeon]|jgi:hypothetical protein
MSAVKKQKSKQYDQHGINFNITEFRYQQILDFIKKGLSENATVYCREAVYQRIEKDLAIYLNHEGEEKEEK